MELSFTFTTRNSTTPSAKIIFHYYANYNENMVEIIFGTLPKYSESFLAALFPHEN